MSGTYILLYNPILQPLGPLAIPEPNAILTVWLSGTTTLTPIYADGGGVSQLANPLTANGAGIFPPIYLNPSINYRIHITDQNLNLLIDIDPYVITGIQNALTQAEINAGITVVNYNYAPGNVIRYGADPTGVADSTAAIQKAVMVNQPVYFPAGTYSVSSMITLTIPYQRLYGDGLLSTIFATAGFNLAQQGVFNFTAGGNDDGPWFENLHFSCDQSVVASSGNRSNLIQYPALLFMRNAPRLRVINCKVEHFLIFCDMQGLSSGAVFDGVDCGVYLYGVVINGSGDTIRFKDFHGVTGFNSWTSNQRAIAGDGNCTWIVTGRNDGMDLSDCLFLGPGTSVNSFAGTGLSWGTTNYPTTPGVYGNTYSGSGFLTGFTEASQFTNCGFDTGETWIQSGVGSWFLLSNCYWSIPQPTGGNTNTFISITAGDLHIVNNWFNGAARSTPLININNASGQYVFFSLKGCSFNLAGPVTFTGYTLLYAAGTNGAGPVELIVTDNEFIQPNVANTSPMIQTVGNGVNITLNANRWTGNLNSPTALSIDTDNYHVIADNSFNGWGISLPAVHSLANISHNSPRGTLGFNNANITGFAGNSGSTAIAANTTTYLGPGEPANNPNEVAFLSPNAGNIIGFYVRAGPSPGAGTSTYTVFLNGFATTMTGSLTGSAQTLIVTTNNFAVVTGDLVELQLVNDPFVTAGFHAFSIRYEPA